MDTLTNNKDPDEMPECVILSGSTLFAIKVS